MQIRALVGGKVDQGSIRDTEVRCEILSLGKFFITILLYHYFAKVLQTRPCFDIVSGCSHVFILNVWIVQMINL